MILLPIIILIIIIIIIIIIVFIASLNSYYYFDVEIFNDIISGIAAGENRMINGGGVGHVRRKQQN